MLNIADGPATVSAKCEHNSIESIQVEQDYD